MISTIFGGTHAQAYTDTMTVACIYIEPAGVVGSNNNWVADGSVEGYSVEWSREGDSSVGLEVSSDIASPDPNFTTTIIGSYTKTQLLF